MDEEAKRGGETAGVGALEGGCTEIMGFEFASLTTGN